MSHRIHSACASVLLAGALLAQEPVPTFDATAKLVQIPFNVERGRYFVADLQPSDFILHEDGHPRDFSVFEGPHTQNPLPLELILLFDTTVVPPQYTGGMLGQRAARADYDFLNNWDDSVTREVLQRNGMDIRLAVYHFAGSQVERLCEATSDPREIVHAFRSLLDPIPPGKGELTPLPGYKVAKPMFGPPFLGWLNESIVATLRDATASPLPARRMLVVFSLGMGGTTPPWKSTDNPIVDHSRALNIPINPVELDFANGAGRIFAGGPNAASMSSDGFVKGASDKLGYIHSTSSYANMFGFLPMGEQTGGSAFIPPHLDREALAGILDLVRDTTLSRYVVGFAPGTAVEAPAKAKKHSLAVTMASKSKGKLIGGKRDEITY